MFGEGLQGADREAGVEGQHHPGRQQGVAAEQRHEPGHAGGDHGALRMLRVEDAQRAEVLHAAAQHGRQARVSGADLGAAPPPFPELAGGLGVFDRAAARVPQQHRDPVDGRDRFDGGGPLAAGGQRHLPAQPPRVHVQARVRAGADKHALLVPATPASDGERVACGLDGDVAGQLRPSVLHLEQVGEVGASGQRHRAAHLGVAEVADGEVFTHPVADVAVANHQQGAVGQPGGWGHAADERGCVGVAVLDGQRLRHGPVDGQLPAGQHPSVADEQAMGAAGLDVTGRAADAERRAFDQGHRLRSARRTQWLAGERPGLGQPCTCAAGAAPLLPFRVRGLWLLRVRGLWRGLSAACRAPLSEGVSRTRRYSRA